MLMARVYYAFIIFCVTAVLLEAVYVRSVNNRLFYKFCQCTSEQSRLKQQLGNKQLQVESIINPASVWKSIGGLDNKK